MDLLRDVRGCTFDDFLLAPRYSVVDRRDPASLDLSSRLTPRLTLRRPIVSANMDSVTESPMARALALEGGIGVVHRAMPIESQAREIESVKRSHGWVVEEPSRFGRYARTLWSVLLDHERVTNE